MEDELRWLGLLNVRYHLGPQPLNGPHLRQVTENPLLIYENPAVLPRAFWLTSTNTWPFRLGIDSSVVTFSG